MELTPQEPGVVGDFADLDVRVVGRLAGDPQAACFQALLILAIELVTVAMALVDLAGAVSPVREAVLGELTGPATQPHGAAEFVHSLEFAQLENDAVGG